MLLNEKHGREQTEVCYLWGRKRTKYMSCIHSCLSLHEGSIMENMNKQKNLNKNGYLCWVGGSGAVRKRMGATLFMYTLSYYFYL